MAQKPSIPKGTRDFGPVEMAKRNYIFNTIKDAKTKEMVEVLGNIKADKKTLIVMDEKDDNVIKSAHNIPGVRTALVTTMNVYDIVNHYTLVLTEAAAKRIEEVYA